jgi:hypothetical protein
MRKQGTFLGIPYDWRPLTPKRFRSRIWDKDNHKLFSPKAFGCGYTINIHELLHRKKLLLVILILILALGIFTYQKKTELTKAHSTFKNYYTFRGCTKLIKRTDTYGICNTNNGETIKIVKFNNKWFLDGDLPWACVGKICFGF